MTGIPEFSTSSTVIGALKVARGFFAAPSHCTTETIANCSSVDFVVPAQAGTQGSGASSLAPGPPLSRGRRQYHVAQYQDREQSRRPHWPVGLLELAREARRRDNIAGAPDAGAAALSCVISTVSQ